MAVFELAIHSLRNIVYSAEQNTRPFNICIYMLQMDLA